MARLNRLPLAMAVLSAAVASQAQALGLGDITLHSALNQPLDAEIALLQVGDLTSDELLAHLASVATFERLGVERPSFLQNLRFTPVIRGGRSYIHVVSSQAVREPYLNFLVEVERPNGSLLREYTVLLDPADYAASRNSVSSVPAGDSVAADSPRSSSRGSAARQARKPAVASTPGDGRYTTVSGDSLWSIAKRLAGSGVSRQTYMAQLQQLNPQAFVGGNPHRLRVGQTLVLPAGATPGSAAASVAVQAPPSAVAPPAAPAPGASPSALDQAETQLVAMNAERDKLNQRMDDLQKQLLTLQQNLESRDKQVQQLQAELAKQQTAPAAAAAPAVVAPTPAKAVQAVPAVASAVAPDSSSLRIWPWAAAGGIGLLLLAMLYMRRQKTQDAEPPHIKPLAASMPPRPVVTPAAVAKTPAAAAVAVPAAASAARAVAAAPSANDAALAKLPAASSDSLEGANIYIAYGRFGQARDMLLKAVAAEPQRRELRMKLLLVLAELGEADAFREQEKALLDIGGEQKQIDQLKTRYPAMLERHDEPTASDSLGDWDGLELNELSSEPAPGAQTLLSDSEPLLGDSELNLGDLPLDLDWSAMDPFESPKPGKAPAAVQTSLKVESDSLLDDFRSNLRELPEVTEFDIDGEHAGAFGLPSRTLDGEQDMLLAGLDEARACIDHGDLEQAYRILKRIIQDGDSREREEARELLAQIA